MKVGIVGVTGLVGIEILRSIELLSLIDHEYYLFSSKCSAGKIMKLFNKEHIVKEWKNECLFDIDYCIIAVDNLIAKNIITYSKTHKSNCVIIDNSSEFRMDKDVPLIVPEINMHSVKSYHKIIANPNCTTTMLVMLLNPIIKCGKIKKVIVSTYQASSGAGKMGYDELITQTDEISKDKPLTTDFWKKQYVYNVFSHNSSIDLDTLYNKEELKMINETKKILCENITIVPTCIRVPVLRCHCLSVNVQFDREVKRDDIIESIKKINGIKIMEDIKSNSFPEPVLLSGKIDIFVGRIRPDIDDNSSWNFWVCGDQLLKGAAYNSVQILRELLIKIE
jgi:aspartate-semialdehyde dehydrogenase